MKKSAGFSMIEILVVVMICGMIISVISNIPPIINLIGSGNRDSTARQIIATKINDLRSTGFNNLVNGTSQISDSRISTFPKATSSVEIQDCPVLNCAAGEEVKYVKVTLSWTENSNIRSISANTLIGSGGLR